MDTLPFNVLNHMHQNDGDPKIVDPNSCWSKAPLMVLLPTSIGCIVLLPDKFIVMRFTTGHFGGLCVLIDANLSWKILCTLKLIMPKS
jgi:hypothetical protein